MFVKQETVISSAASSSVAEAAATVSTSPQESDDADSAATPAPLTTAALAGIGIGAGVAALGSGFALYLLLRRRRSSHHDRPMLISQPMPGSGRDYSGGFGSISDRGGMSELEAKSKRYEDMIPRMSPKSII
jgi:hypothetical protein